MKFFGKVLLTLLLLILLALVLLYFLLQTAWAATWISKTLSENSPYQISFSKLEHHFSSPGHLIVNHISFGRTGEPASLIAQRADLGLDRIQFSVPRRFSSILLEKGTLNITDNALPFQAARLQVNQMTINAMSQGKQMTAHQVSGGILNWQPQHGNPMGENARFKFSAGSLLFDGLPATNVLIDGGTDADIDGQQLMINNFGADVAQGSVTASARRDAQGQWQVASLRLNSLRWQNNQSLTAFLTPLTTLPAVQIDHLDVTDARFEGTGWAITDLDMTLKDILLRNGDWQSDNGSLSMNAASFVNGGLQLNDPIINIAFTHDGVMLKQASSRWANGLIRTSGKWTRSDKKLKLDTLAIAGLEYTLPQQWRDRWMAPLPAWLSDVEVTKFEANRNLIIDINPDFPFQMTSLEGSGSNLLLARQHQWGLWAGQIGLNAAEATWNRTDVRHPSLSLSADENRLQITEMSAFADQGIIEGKATLSQQPQRNLSLSLKGHQVPVNLLQNWGWPALPVAGKGDLQLSITGSLAAKHALKSTVNGTLSVITDEKSLIQTMQAGQVAGSAH